VNAKFQASKIEAPEKIQKPSCNQTMGRMGPMTAGRSSQIIHLGPRFGETSSPVSAVIVSLEAEPLFRQKTLVFQ
jgi:hypothetical protein